MKQNLIIKINDIIIEVAPSYDKAIKRSIEFFLGGMFRSEEIEIFRQKKCPATNKACIDSFLNEKGLFLRENAIIKKFNEYYLGKEFDGLIKDCAFLVELKELKALSKKYNLILLALMQKEECDFLVKKFELNEFNVVLAQTPNEGIEIALKDKKDPSLFIGNSNFDYEAAVAKRIEFIGIDFSDKTKNIIAIENIKEMIN